MSQMQSESIQIIEDCSRLSAEGKIHFGEVVSRLIAAGIERYHVDYCRDETTYYVADGSSHVINLQLGQMPPIADAFSAATVESSVRQAQRGEIMYPQFTRQVLAAGCVGYFVLLTGQCVQYLGRRGETHTEWFPGAARTT